MVSVVGLVLDTFRAHSSNTCSSSMASSSWSYRRPAALKCAHPVNARSMPAISPLVDVSNGITVRSVLCIRQRRGVHAWDDWDHSSLGWWGIVIGSCVVATRASQFYTAEFSIRQNVRGYMLPTWWSYMLHKYGAYSGPFRLPAVGCTAVMEAPIDWGSMEALPATSERCESLVTSQPDRQVARPFRNARF